MRRDPRPLVPHRARLAREAWRRTAGYRIAQTAALARGDLRAAHQAANRAGQWERCAQDNEAMAAEAAATEGR